MKNPDVLARLYALLGDDAILLPIPLGKKKPIFNEWEKTTLAQTLSAAWQAKLRAANIGVLLGERGNGIVTIDCDTEEFAAEMLSLNPQFAEALQSRGSRGQNFWLRCTGDFPRRVAKLKDRRIKTLPNEVGEWRADGGQTVIFGKHPSGCDYGILHEAPPLPVDFANIRWPGWIKSTLWTRTTKLAPACNTATQVTQPLSLSANTGTQVVSVSGVVFHEVGKFLPSAIHENNALLFNLARALLDLERQMGRQLSRGELAEIFEEWHRRNQHLDPANTRDAYWIEFQRAVENAKVPLSQSPITFAIEIASKSPIPEVAASFTDLRIRWLVAVLWQLQLLTAPHPFFITARVAGEIAGVDHTTAWRWLQSFCSKRFGGFLELVKHGSLAAGEGNEYRFRDRKTH